MSESSSPKENLRAKFFASKPRRSMRVQAEGMEFELRNPTLAARRAFAREAKEDGTLYNVLAVIECTFVPGTDEKVFSAHDRDAMMAHETGSLVDVLSIHLAKIMREASEAAEEAAKK